MLRATFTLKSLPGSDLMFGRKIHSKKLDSETNEQHEERTWREKINCNDDGEVVIVPFALKNALESAGKWLNRPIPGEGKKTYTARLRAGILPEGPLVVHNGKDTPVKRDDVEGVPLFVRANKSRGDTRVTRILPRISSWTAHGSCLILDDKISKDIFRDHLKCIGQFIGVGSMRVENGGTNGRFEVAELEFEEV